MTPEAVLIENMLKIADKNGEDVQFHLNATQRSLDEGLTGRDIIPKARQEGVSSYFLARYTIKCLTQRNTRAVVISHESDATQRMLAKVHYFLEHLQPKAIVGHSSKGEITFPKMNSMFYIGTAGSRKFGRGDTITNLHCSEIAFWEDAKTLMTGLMQAVPESEKSEVAIESTGNGQGNYYHKLVMEAVRGRSHYRVHFFNWQDFPEYNLPVTEEEELEILSSLDPDLDEPDLMERWGLTAGQIKFRRRKLFELEFDTNKFDQEYPKTLDECFLASGTGIFRKINFAKHDEWSEKQRNLMGLVDHPQPRKHYLIGADVGAGIGKDRSVAQICEAQTLEQVATYATDNEAPDDFGKTLILLGTMYNMAYITVEANNYGVTTLDHLSAKDSEGNYLYPPELIYAEDRSQQRGANEPQQLVYLGFRTTHTSKPWMIGKLRSSLATRIVLHDEDTKSELSTFIEKDGGKLEAEEGCFDDRVIALAMVAVGDYRAPAVFAPPSASTIERVDPYSLEAAIHELRNRHKEFPIAPQTI